MEKLGNTPEEAADALGVGRTFIFEALRDGRLERRKAGARTIIPVESLKAFLAALPRGGEGEPKAAA
jgi:excisionase family DNA binding protein